MLKNDLKNMLGSSGDQRSNYNNNGSQNLSSRERQGASQNMKNSYISGMSKQQSISINQ